MMENLLYTIDVVLFIVGVIGLAGCSIRAVIYMIPIIVLIFRLKPGRFHLTVSC
jgi:hypothetical protein